ncbi:MAG: pyrimidine 5'-nucleotidase [Rhizobiales bacterium]|nr:pyrimidine 5'-nucleotidase [Hyphomicrobiales bacterium]
MTACARDDSPGACRCFAGIDVWIFDLDNTLYPAECNLFPQVADRMNLFIERRFGFSPDEARRMRRDYYLEFGTTLAGLMQRHAVEPDEFLHFVHDIDHSVLAPAPELAAAIARLPGRRYIFTNGSRGHAEAVAGKVGVLDLFDDVFDIKAANYVPKPHRSAFDLFLSRHGLEGARAAMFEDLPHNLVTAHELGMTTVLISSSMEDHPSQREIGEWDAPPDHIHHVTDDLAGFLSAIELPPLAVRT